MNEYVVLKTVHILSSTLLFGTGIGSAFYMLFASLNRDPRIVFSVAWAKGGYLPTHNPNYRLPQGPDPVWNNANCRNRRLFSDRAVKKVAANTKPFLLQTYRRDMGGGNFVLMKDLSSPIHVRGRHWGAFRMGFRQS